MHDHHVREMLGLVKLSINNFDLPITIYFLDFRAKIGRNINYKGVAVLREPLAGHNESFVFVTKTSFIENSKGTLGTFKRDFDILEESLGMDNLILNLTALIIL